MKISPFAHSTRSKALFAFVVVFTAWKSAAFAADAGNQAANIQIVLEKIYQELATKTIALTLPEKEFAVDITVTPRANDTQNLPYFTDKLRVHSLAAMDLQDVRGYTEKVAIEVFLNPRYGKKTRGFLKKILWKKLRLSTERNDTLKFRTLPVQLDAENSAVSEQLSKVAEELNNEKAKVGSLSKERETLTQIVKRLELSKGLEIRLVELFSKYRLPVLILGSMLLLLLLGVVSAFVYSMTYLGRRVGTGLSLMADSLQQPLQSNSIGISQGPLLINRPPGGGEIGGLSNQADARYLPHVSVTREQLTHDVQNINSLLNPTNEWVLLAYLSNAIDARETAPKGIAALEMIGKDKAAALFRKLEPRVQASLMRTLNSATIEHDRVSTMVRVIEDLKARFLAESISPRNGQVASALLDKMSKLTFEQCKKIMMSLVGDLLARFLYHMQPTYLSKIIAGFRLEDSNNFDKVVKAVFSIPHVAEEINLDVQLLITVEGVFETANNSLHANYMGFYKEVLEAMDDDSSDSVMANIQELPELQKALRQAVVKLENLFNIPSDVRDRILSSLSNREIATLIGGISSTQRDELLAAIGPRRRDSIEEEAVRMKNRGRSDQGAAFKTVRANIISKLKAYQSDASEDPMATQMGDLKNVA